MKSKKNNYDVVIIGAGLSGSSAAAEAGDRGLSTLVVEKGRHTGGTGSYVEGVFAVESNLQKERGVKLTKEYILKEEYEWTHGLADMAVWKKYVNQAADNVEWLKGHGAVMTKMRTLGTGDDTWHLFDGHGKQAINEGLLPSAKGKGVEVITSAQVIRLSLDLDGKVAGVTIKDFESGEEFTVSAKSVIIATGGYLNNQELLNSNPNHNADRIIPVNSGKNTGDGLKLAWSVGAKKYGMGTVMMFGGQVFDNVPGYMNWMRQVNRAVTHEAPLWVNETGRRFAKEDCTDIWAIAGNTLIRQDKVYAILDQKQIDELSLKYDSLKEDIRSDIDSDKPYLTVADSIEALASELNLPDLSSSVIRYNHLVKEGADSDFGKDAKYLHEVSDGPFYAFELGVGAFCTMGGLRVDVDNHVLDDNGNWIQGLYAIGTDGSAPLVGDTYGVNIPGSEAGYCVYSGRNAVSDIAK